MGLLPAEKVKLQDHANCAILIAHLRDLALPPIDGVAADNEGPENTETPRRRRTGRQTRSIDHEERLSYHLRGPPTHS
jgi:hypothetical protein